MVAIILASFTREAALAGEKVQIISGPNCLGEVEAKLLGDSAYIRNNTDGYVILLDGEYRAV